MTFEFLIDNQALEGEKENCCSTLNAKQLFLLKAKQPSRLNVLFALETPTTWALLAPNSSRLFYDTTIS